MAGTLEPKSAQRVNQPQLIAAISKHLGEEQGIAEMNTRQFNAIIKSANEIVHAFEQKDIPATKGMGVDAWLKSDDTGLSSRCMADHMCGIPQNWRYSQENPYPQDPADFGRCHRFLLAVGMNSQDILHCMGHVSREWGMLAAHWEELTGLWMEESPTGSAPKLYQRMRELVKVVPPDAASLSQLADVCKRHAKPKRQ